jgi:hypothetical protein
MVCYKIIELQCRVCQAIIEIQEKVDRTADYLVDGRTNGRIKMWKERGFSSLALGEHVMIL